MNAYLEALKWQLIRWLAVGDIIWEPEARGPEASGCNHLGLHGCNGGCLKGQTVIHTEGVQDTKHTSSPSVPTPTAKARPFKPAHANPNSCMDAGNAVAWIGTWCIVEVVQGPRSKQE